MTWLVMLVSEVELLDVLKTFSGDYAVRDIVIRVETGDDEEDYKLSKKIINILKPTEEFAERRKQPKEVFLREYKVKGILKEIAYKVLTRVNDCFEAEIEKDKITVRVINCPPCREGAVTEIRNNYYLISGGRIIEKINDNLFRVYTCRVKPPSF